MDAIFTGVSDPTEFEERGIRDAEILSRFVRTDSIAFVLGCGIGMVENCLPAHADVANIELYRNNGCDLSEFLDRTFDLVFTLLVFHHLDKNDT